MACNVVLGRHVARYSVVEGYHYQYKDGRGAESDHVNCYFKRVV